MRDDGRRRHGRTAGREEGELSCPAVPVLCVRVGVDVCVCVCVWLLRSGRTVRDDWAYRGARKLLVGETHSKATGTAGYRLLEVLSQRRHGRADWSPGPDTIVEVSRGCRSDVEKKEAASAHRPMTWCVSIMTYRKARSLWKRASLMPFQVALLKRFFLFFWALGHANCRSLLSILSSCFKTSDFGKNCDTCSVSVEKPTKQHNSRQWSTGTGSGAFPKRHQAEPVNFGKNKKTCQYENQKGGRANLARDQVAGGCVCVCLNVYINALPLLIYKCMNDYWH